MDSNLSKNVKMTRVKNAVAAGQAEIDSSILDMAGFDGVLFVFLFGAITDTSNIVCKAQGNSTNATGGMADIAGATSTLVAAGSGNGVLYVDVFRPQLEFVRAVVLPTVANAALDGILAIQYKAKKAPTIHDATTILQGALAAF